MKSELFKKGGKEQIAESIAFTPEEMVEATKDFVGVIVNAEYGTSPLGMVGRADIEARAQLAIQISTPTYEKTQYEWFAPSKVILTKWSYFIGALNKCGALKITNTAGATADEKMKNFAASLIGLKFRWLERMKLEGAARPIERLLLPEEYLGKEEVVKPQKIETEDVVIT